MKTNHELPKGLITKIAEAVKGYDPQDVEWFARQAHGRGHYDALEELGVPLTRFFERDAVDHITGLIAQGFLDHIPTSTAEFRKQMQKEAIPRIRETHTRTVEWFIENMPPDMLEQLVDAGAVLNLTEWDNTDGTVVCCNFYAPIDDDSMQMIAWVEWDVSQNTHSITWLDEA